MQFGYIMTLLRLSRQKAVHWSSPHAPWNRNYCQTNARKREDSFLLRKKTNPVKAWSVSPRLSSSAEMIFTMTLETEDLRAGIRTRNHNSYCSRVTVVYPMLKQYGRFITYTNVVIAMKPYNNKIITLWCHPNPSAVFLQLSLSVSVGCIYPHWIWIYFKVCFIRSQYLISHHYWNLLGSKVFGHT